MALGTKYRRIDSDIKMLVICYKMAVEENDEEKMKKFRDAVLDSNCARSTKQKYFNDMMDYRIEHDKNL